MDAGRIFFFCDSRLNSWNYNKNKIYFKVIKWEVFMKQFWLIFVQYSPFIIGNWFVDMGDKIIIKFDRYKWCILRLFYVLSTENQLSTKSCPKPRTRYLFVCGVIRNSHRLMKCFFVCTDIYVQCASDAGGSFLQINYTSGHKYLQLFQTCLRKFQPRLTVFFHR